jgi:hypothetical protein
MSPVPEAEHIGPDRGMLERRGEKKAHEPHKGTRRCPWMAERWLTALRETPERVCVERRDNRRGGGMLKGVPSRRGRRP